MHIRQFFERIPALRGIAQRNYVRHRDNSSKSSPKKWIQKICRWEKGIVVQIGSNDGKTGDPIYDWLKEMKDWSAVFVEPVPYLFNRLKSNYPEKQRFRFENSLINDGAKTPFYWVSQKAKESIPDLPPWHDQLGGFSREHITNHIPELEPFIKETILSGTTLGALFHKYELENVDLLHIDTEGADWMILKQLDFKKVSPLVILYERKHLSIDDEIASIQFLQRDYILYNFGDDIMAIQKAVSRTTPTSLKPLRRLRVPDFSTYLEKPPATIGRHS